MLKKFETPVFLRIVIGLFHCNIELFNGNERDNERDNVNFHNQKSTREKRMISTIMFFHTWATFDKKMSISYRPLAWRTIFSIELNNYHFFFDVIHSSLKKINTVFLQAFSTC